MVKSRFLIVLLTAALPFFMVSCDTTYLVRGTVTEQKIHGPLSINYMNDAAVQVFYIGNKGNIGLVVDHKFITDTNGKYEIFFVGPPFGLGHDVFLEFKKPGYLQKQIFVSDDNKDSDATVKRCPEKQPYQGCWVIDVRMTPEAEQIK